MTNKELYQATFSQVYSSVPICFEDMEKRYVQRWKTSRRVLFSAAVICLLAAFSTVAVANNWFGLRDLEIKEEITVTEPDGTETVVEVPTGTISLQGYSETPEQQAAKEWQAFLHSYDPDYEILNRIGNSPTGLEEEYGFYGVYTQEMADRLEEILAKYGLKKHIQRLDNLYPKEALCAQVGGDFLGENQAYSAYMYEDGTFKFDGNFDLAGFGPLEYQFMRCVRGSFTDVRLNIGDIHAYREWVYTTEDGTPVTLALGPAKGLIIADLADSFVTVNVLAGTENAGLTHGDMEQFAESFVFSVLTPARKPQVAISAD